MHRRSRAFTSPPIPQALPAPYDLRADSLVAPIGIGANPPFLTWTLEGTQTAAEVEVEEERSDARWQSGVIETTVAGVRYRGALRSRGRYRWRVRVRDESGKWSAWSDSATFEFGLLSPDDWRAQWIARAVPARTRTIRSLRSDVVDWVDTGHRIGQDFTSDGPVTSVSADLVAVLNDDIHGRLEVLDRDQNVVASVRLDGVPFVWDRFSRYIELDPPAAPGTYRVELVSEQGRIGWRTSILPAEAADTDDGISPLAITGVATRDGRNDRGTRALGVETSPAPNPVLRTVFELNAVGSARLHGVGVGYGIFRVNGRVVGDEVLEPAPTNYDKTILVRTWDVEHLLVSGRNELSVELGRGFFAARGASNWGWNLHESHTEPVAIAQLEIESLSGGQQIVCTDGSWEGTESEVVTDLLYGGEHQSAGARQWERVVCVPGPRGVLRPASMPPVRRQETVHPASSKIASGATTYDFGVTMSGWVRCRVEGRSGDTVTIRYGESLDDRGHAHCDNELAVGDAQLDAIELKDSLPVTWEPRFVYRGFRFATVTSAGAEVTEVEAVRVHTDVEKIGEVSCGDETLTWIAQATERTFLNNLHGIPTDTPIYEKNGWTADGHLISDSIMLLRDMRSTFQKWLDDHVDAQDERGVIPQIIPTPGWGSEPDPAWSGSLALIAWDLYWETGDREVLRRFIEPIRRYTDRLLELADDGLWKMHSWGDWLSPGYSFAPETGTPAATMMLYQVTRITARICTALEEAAAARAYSDRADVIARAYHREYFDEVLHEYRVPGLGYRQAMNVLPLAFDATPRHERGRVAASLIHDIEHRTRGFHDTGALGLKHLLPVLSDFGRADLAISVATQSCGPSWGSWRQAGHTTLLESWDEDVRSHNHFFLGAATAWVAHRVVGVRATLPGWEAIDLQPVIDERVSWGRLRHQTVRGEMSVQWRRHSNELRGQIRVPNGATATVGAGDDAMVLGPGLNEFAIHVDSRPPRQIPSAKRITSR